MTGGPHPTLETLGEDLILLSPLTVSGSINAPLRLAYGLMGSELIRLVADGYVELVKGRIQPLAATPPADTNLQEALNSMRGSPKAKRWVGKPRKQIQATYLRQLEARNIVRSESGKSLKVFPWRRWYPVDRQRHIELQRRLDQIIAARNPLGIEDRSLAGLAYASGLSDLIYVERKEQRERLEQIARPKKPGRLSRHGDETPEPRGVATSTAIDAAHQAAIDTAVQAAIDQAVISAVDAAISAAVDGGGGGGHDGGGGHGGGGHV